MDIPIPVLVVLGVFAYTVLFIVWDLWGYRYRVPAVDIAELLEPSERTLLPPRPWGQDRFPDWPTYMATMTDRRVIWVRHEARQWLLPFSGKSVVWPPNWLRQTAWFDLRRDEIINARIYHSLGIWTLVLTGTRPSALRFGRAYFVEFKHEPEAQHWLSTLKS